MRRDGYGQCFLGPARGLTSAHRASWLLAYGPIPPGLYVLHRCDHKTCVRPSHLFLGTAADNARDRERKGRGNPPRGERAGRAKLTEAQVRHIRSAYAAGARQCDLARELGVHDTSVHYIVVGKTWRHVAAA